MTPFIVLLGPPGAGKGTQAKRVSERTGIPHISTGNYFRKLGELDTPLARDIKQTMDAGQLVSDQQTLEIVMVMLDENDCKIRGALFDGYPRNLSQAADLEKVMSKMGEHIDVAPLLEVRPEVIEERILGRASREGRTDDNLETARARYRVYQEQTFPLVKYYDEKGLLFRIDGEQGMDSVTAELEVVLRKYI
jgi:adenylate kinase